MDFANKIAVLCGATEIHKQKLDQLMVPQRGMGRIGIPEDLSHGSMVGQSCKSGCELAHSTSRGQRRFPANKKFIIGGARGARRGAAGGPPAAGARGSGAP